MDKDDMRLEIQELMYELIELNENCGFSVYNLIDIRNILVKAKKKYNNV